MNSRILQILLCGSLLLNEGCGSSGPRIVQIDGLVTRKGQPVANLFLNFVPDEGRPSWAISDEQGRFKLNYDRSAEGALTGKHVVFVSFRARDPKEEMAFLNGTKKHHPDARDILAKFGKQEISPLRVVIESAGQKVHLELD